MAQKVMTGFRLYQETLDRMDAIVESPPPWLASTAVHPVQDRTDLVERLIFWVAQQVPKAGTVSDQPASETPAKKRGQKAKK